jgi:hypothetical protein
MKIYLFFEEDDTGITEFTDFKTDGGFYNLCDLKKYFKHTTIDYKSPYRVRFFEALKILCAENINLESAVIKERLNIKEVEE